MSIWVGSAGDIAGVSVEGSQEAEYAAKVLALNPIAYWIQGEHEGSIAYCQVNPSQNGTYTAVTLGNEGIGDGQVCPLYDGANSYADVYSAALAAAFDGDEGTVAIWAKVSAVGVWTDGLQHNVFRFAVDANNSVEVYKAIVNNRLTFSYIAGGTNDVVLRDALVDIGWMHLAIAWSASAGATGELKAYFNGIQTGATQVGLGAWAGALASFATVIAAATIAPINVWSGYLAHAALWDSALTDPQIASLATT